eukprot:c25621_g1_i3 orf=372-2570(-)
MPKSTSKYEKEKRENSAGRKHLISEEEPAGKGVAQVKENKCLQPNIKDANDIINNSKRAMDSDQNGEAVKDLNQNGESVMDLQQSTVNGRGVLSSVVTHVLHASQLPAILQEPGERKVSETNNQAIDQREVILRLPIVVQNQIDKKMSALPEGQREDHVVKLELQGWEEHVVNSLAGKPQEDLSVSKLGIFSKMTEDTNCTDTDTTTMATRHGLGEKTYSNETRSFSTSENSCKPDTPMSEANLGKEVNQSTNNAQAETLKTCKADNLVDKTTLQGKVNGNASDGAAISPPLLTATKFLQYSSLQNMRESDGQQEMNFSDDAPANSIRGVINSGLCATSGQLEQLPLKRQGALENQGNSLHSNILQQSERFTMRRHSRPSNNSDDIHIRETLLDHAPIAGERLGAIDIEHSATEANGKIRSDGDSQGKPFISNFHDQCLANNITSHLNDQMQSLVASSHANETVQLNDIPARLRVPFNDRQFTGILNDEESPSQFAAKMGIGVSMDGEEYMAMHGRIKSLSAGTTNDTHNMAYVREPNCQNDSAYFQGKKSDLKFPLQQISGLYSSHYYETASLADSPSACSKGTPKAFLTERNSRVGDILEALRLTKAHIRNSIDEQHSYSPYCRISDDASSPAKVSRPSLAYPLHKDQHLPCETHNWNSYATSWSGYSSSMQLPTIAAPHSGFTNTGRQDALRRTKSTSESFMMPTSFVETYHSPRRKVQLGNGITLYTD